MSLSPRKSTRSKISAKPRPHIPSVEEQVELENARAEHLLRKTESDSLERAKRLLRSRTVERSLEDGRIRQSHASAIGMGEGGVPASGMGEGGVPAIGMVEGGVPAAMSVYCSSTNASRAAKSSSESTLDHDYVNTRDSEKAYPSKLSCDSGVQHKPPLADPTRQLPTRRGDASGVSKGLLLGGKSSAAMDCSLSRAKDALRTYAVSSDIIS